jgi:hypothetical protein
MCSIEEAWAGQTFDNYPVQSQADLRRKYMPIGENILARNNDFNITRKEPAPRMDNYGFNTLMVRDIQRTPPVTRDASNELSVNMESAPIKINTYGGINPLPAYMSIYDNVNSTNGNGNDNMPMPSAGTRNNFNDLNQAFQVSPVVERFMKSAQSNNNSLQNEDNEEEIKVLAKKFNSINSNNANNSNNTYNSSNFSNETLNLSETIGQLQVSLQDVIARIDQLERDIHNGQSRNMCDMVLYILVGMLIAFILYSLLRK